MTLSVTTPNPTKDLTTLEMVKAELLITDTSQDTWLANAIRQASDGINSYCNRPEGFGIETVVQTERNIVRHKAIVLERDLSPTITSVVEDEATLSGATDYELDAGLLYRVQDDVCVPWCANKVVVTYTAGYVLMQGVPFDLERCCLDLVTRLHHARGRDPVVRSEKILDVIDQSYWGGTSVATHHGIPSDIAERLDVFVRRRL